MKVSYIALIVLVLASCAPKTQVTTPIRALEKGENAVVNLDLNLIAFPRSVIYASEGKGQRTTLEFATPIQMATVYNFFDMQFTGDGWKRENVVYTQRLNKYEGSYTKSGQRLEVVLKLENDRYRLETK
jgi:hypothetical protein